MKTRALVWLALLIGIAAAWLGVWIYLPPPTYFLLTFAVGAPEVSHWTIVAALLGVALAASAMTTSRVARVAVALNALAILMSVGVWVRVPSVLQRFDVAARGHIAMPASARRAKPIVVADLFRGIHVGDANVTRRIAVKNVDGQQLTADVYAPTQHGQFPIVVQIYGGSWQHGSPSDFSKFATWLAADGYVVVAIDYRHAPTYRWPAQIDDVNDALRWVAAHGVEYGGDTSRVALIGRSAGAHLATYAAWISAPIHLRSVISLYGPVDLVTSYEHPPQPDPLGVRPVEESLIGGSLAAWPKQYADASTITHLATLATKPPPSLLIYGGRDNIVEARYGQRIATALAATGADVTYLEIPWAEHAFDAVFSGASSQIALFYIERFLAKTLS
ncbi:MAG TPA: alpha/beta hydrolase [Gemmatimonadaceae bacterium]